MDKFLHKKNRTKFDNWFKEIDKATGSHLSERYGNWLSIMDAAHVNYRRPVPAGLSGCLDYVSEKRELQLWLQGDYFVPHTPEFHLINDRILIGYDFGLSFYFTHKREVTFIIDECEKQFGFLSSISSASQTDNEVMLKKFNTIRNKVMKYEQIIARIAIAELGLEAKPLLDNFIFGRKVKDISTAESCILEKLKMLEEGSRNSDSC